MLIKRAIEENGTKSKKMKPEGRKKRDSERKRVVLKEERETREEMTNMKILEKSSRTVISRMLVSKLRVVRGNVYRFKEHRRLHF